MSGSRLMMKKRKTTGTDDYVAFIERTIKTFSDDGMDSVGSYAFNSCSEMTAISLIACTTIGEQAFSGCTKLASVDLPACTSVGNYAFSSCSNLKTLTLPACTSVAQGIIRWTSNMTINLPACTSVSSSAFSGCYGTTSVHFAAENQATIEALSGYSNKFGTSTITIYFDL